MNRSSVSEASQKPFGMKTKPVSFSTRIRPQTLDAAYMTSDELLLLLRTSELGLTDLEAANRLAEHGLNEVAYHRTVPVV